MKLVVAEKPSVGREIARVLGCRTKGEGFLSGADYVVTWAFGHLVTLQDPGEINPAWKKWRAQDLPMLPEILPTKVIPKTRSQYQVIKKWMGAKEIDRIICATDAGREGELIFGLIYEQAGCKKPVDRLWISSLTDAAIREGFENLKSREDYMGLYQSAVCRSEADWLVGMNASRAFTLCYNALLSLGRVQTPTLAILVARAREIRDFKPEEYHTLRADFGDYNGMWFDADAKEEKRAGWIVDKEAAESLAKQLRGKEAQVRSVRQEDKRELPPPLFDLTSLQREANRLLGFTADKTLKTSQSLYEQRKAITYPRTDSRYLSRDMVGAAHKAMEQLSRHYLAETALIERKDGKLPFSLRIYNDAKVSDHHAIIPTAQATDPAALPPDERALYDLIVKRFIGVYCPAHEYKQTNVVTRVLMESFMTAGREVTCMGWKQLLSTQGKVKDAEEEKVLPNLKEGDLRKVQGLKVKKETTKPPPPHTDASLLAGMEHAGRQVEDEELREAMKGSGLGTPATRASTIERLIAVRYAQRRGRTIQATPKGEQLIAAAPDEIASPEMTGRWEQALDEIARGKRDTVRFMQGIRRLSAYLVDAAKEPKPGIAFEREVRGRGGKAAAAAQVLSESACPLCGKNVQENSKAFGCTSWREGCRFTLWKDALVKVGGPRLTRTLVAKLLREKSLKGSTGTIALSGEELHFCKSGEITPAIRVSLRYERKAAQ